MHYKFTLISLFILAFLLFIIFYFCAENSDFNSEIPLVTAKNDGIYKKKPDSKIEMIIPYSTSLIYDNLRKKSRFRMVEKFVSVPEEPVGRTIINENDNFGSIENILSNLDLDEQNKDDYTRENTVVLDKVNDSNNTKTIHDENFFIQMINDSDLRHNFTSSEKNSSKVNSSYKLQLAIVASEDEAKQEWKRLVDRFNTILKDDQLLIEMKKNEQGEVIFLVFADNYNSWNDAERVCNQLLFYRQTCIIIK